MTTVSRRTVLGGLVGAGGLAVLGSAAATAATAAPTPGPAAVTEERRRAVVVGTGFGGAITALRLGRAGVDTLVLERGIRWPAAPGSEVFPRMFDPDRRAAWLSPTTVLTGSTPRVWRPYTGVLERVRGLGMDILCGAGVGGGSLVYHGMTLRQSAENFAACMPSVLDYERFAADYYPRAERVLAPAGIPDGVLNHERYRSSRLFLRKVAEAGFPGGFRVPLPIDWNVPRAELRGEIRPSYTTGDVLYGASNGGKNTVDRTWLADAEATGRVQVVTLHVVRDVERDGAGKWVVHVDRIDTDGVVRERKRITTDALFLGAGSAGTTRLLVKARAKGLVPDLPDAVGQNWGNNGDRIYAWAPLTGESPGALQGGPACVGVRDWPSPDRAVTIVQGGVPWPVDIRLTSIIGFGIVEPRGRFVYDPVRDDAILRWSQTYDAELTRRIFGRVQRIVGGSLAATLTNPVIDTSAFETTTYHPLGGATIGDVTDDVGRVRGQRGLYVVDGALIPGSTGAVNPSLTIAALAERNADATMGDAGPVF